MTTQVYVVAGLAYGDEGKGATVDFLVREKGAGLVVRYNGGPQAAHNVVTSDGRHHTFSQFGSGMFVTGVKSHLSRFMLVNPISMVEEEKHLHIIGVSDAFQRATIDAEALIVTPFQQAVNRIEQLALGVHTSCGQGVGQTRADHIRYGMRVLFAGDLKLEWLSEMKLRFMQQVSRKAVEGIVGDEKIREEMRVLEEPAAIDWVADCYQKWAKKVSIVDSLELASLLEGTDCTIFEGAQGVLLDEKYGEEGFNSWTNTTFENAFTLLKECGYVGSVCRLGVIRSYFTRHGDGPLKDEDDYFLRISPEFHNSGSGFQGKFRTGFFDRAAFQFALRCCDGVDAVALNHLDKYMDSPQKLLKEVPVLIHGFGPTAKDREIDKRVEVQIQEGGVYESK